MEQSVYRIIDADFNRAREALRLIEEFCRFSLDCEPLTARAKQIRHQLCAEIARLDPEKLIASRDTVGDVGVGQKVSDQMSRANMKDCFTAACKRLPEALRVLGEVSQCLNPSVAAAMENLRYTAYTLEKDIVLFSDPAEKFKNVKLYIIITSEQPANIISLTNNCIAGGADCIQLRTKDMPDDELHILAVEFVKLCRDAGVVSIINDRIDIAIISGADGVHLGQNDLPIAQAKKLQSRPLIIGKSTHSASQLHAAARQLPTYVALGPIFTTITKPGVEPVGTEYIRLGDEVLTETAIASVAIGGINTANVEEVLKAGAKRIAVCSAVIEASSPKTACRELKQKITDYEKAD